MKSLLTTVLTLAVLLGGVSQVRADSTEVKGGRVTIGGSPYLFNANSCESFEGKGYPFPAKFESSSLVFDPADNSFYTTLDKGSPHIVHFRLQDEAIELLRQDNVVGLTGNFDFEGIEIAGDETGRHLYIATEKFTSFDTLTCFSVDWETWEFEPNNIFKLQLEGAGPNNNLEGIAFDPDHRIFYLAKERQPFALYTYSEKSGQELVFDETDFVQSLTHFLDSIETDCLTDRRRESLKLTSLSGLDFDQLTGHLFALNRYGRAVIELEISPFPGNRFNIVAVYPFKGVDFDHFDRKGIAGIRHYGMAEGLAIYGSGRSRQLALVTDPGPGNRSHLIIFPFPRPASEF